MKIAKRIARNKIYLDRARSYLGYVQLVLLLKLVLSDAGIKNYWILGGSLVFLMVMFLVIGYFDTRLGIRSREMEDNALHNPVLTDILQRIQKIEKK